MSELAARYWGSFAVVTLICITFQAYQKYAQKDPNSAASKASPKFVSFQQNYLIIFLLAMFSDWLQGPYVYQLYVSYGFTQQQIAELFVCGFGSSMIVGTFVGGLADKLGRKGMCIIYCVCYIVACLTKLVPEYWTLMLGRFLSGIATSLLFSVFESWMVCEHTKQGFDASLLGQTFSYATFGNGLVAVVAGLIANSAAESYGFVAPFVLALLPLTCVATLVSLTWKENYGNEQLDIFASLIKGFQLIQSDSRIAALGAAQSCFEGAMYTFVFMWTPALKSDAEKLADAQGGSDIESSSQYLGLIFAVFMVSVMVGSSIFSLMATSKSEILKIPLYLHGAAFSAMALVTIFLENKFIVYVMFLVFETSVGLFYPAYGVIKSDKIPEDIRSAVMNIFRIPLNLFVVLLLLKIKFFTSGTVFAICTVAHGCAFACYGYFYYYERKSAYTRYESVPNSEDKDMV